MNVLTSVAREQKVTYVGEEKKVSSHRFTLTALEKLLLTASPVKSRDQLSVSHKSVTNTSTARLRRKRARRTKNTVHALKTRLDEFVEREYVQTRCVQAALLLLLTDKLQNQLLDKLFETLLGTVTKLTNSLDARYETLSSRVQTVCDTVCLDEC